MEMFVIFAVLLVIVVAAAVIVARLDSDKDKSKPKTKVQAKPVKRDFPIATPGGPKERPVTTTAGDGGIVIGVDAKPPAGVSATRSRIYIVADKRVNALPEEGEAVAGQFGFVPGDTLTFVVEAVTEDGEPVAGIPVRGIVDLYSAKSLTTLPRHGLTGPNGEFRARYTVREEDQIKEGSKLVTAVLLSGDSTITLRPCILNDALA